MLSLLLRTSAVLILHTPAQHALIDLGAPSLLVLHQSLARSNPVSDTDGQVSRPFGELAPLSDPGAFYIRCLCGRW